MDPEATAPPKPRSIMDKLMVLLARAWAFSKSHWDWCGPLFGLMVGWAIGKV